MKRIFVIITAALLVLSLAACEAEAQKKQFESNGITITLTDEFVEEETYDSDAAFVSAELCVYYTADGNKYFGKRIDNMERYCDIVAKAQGVRSDEVVRDGELVYMITEEELLLDEYSRVIFLFGGEGGFSRVEFAVEQAQLDERLPDIIEYAKSVSITCGAE